MGVYYKIVCESRRERIEPGDIDTVEMLKESKRDPWSVHLGGGIKSGAIVNGLAMKVAAAYAISGKWVGHSFRIVSDEANGQALYEDDTLTNVTEDAVRIYNDCYAYGEKLCMRDDIPGMSYEDIPWKVPGVDDDE